MEEKFMELAREKYIQNKEEDDIKERDKRYDQVDICRQFARFSENYGETALHEFFEEITVEVSNGRNE